MKFNTEAIATLLKGGESETVEFKTRLPAGDTVARVLLAFANTKGGVLIIGAADDGAVIGVPEDDVGPSIERLNRIAASLLPFPIEVSCEHLEGKTVIVASVDSAPIYLGPITSSRGEIYERSGENVVVLRSPPLDKLVQAQGRINRKKQSLAAFVAMSFREEQEPALVDYFEAIKRASAKLTGVIEVNLTRMDLVEGDYEISQKIMDEIDTADIIIADLTLNSRNVYYELGYARGKCKRVIQTARKDTQLEFDIRSWRTVIFRNATELEAKLVPELQTAIAELFKENG
ncbi:MAG: ATP-binding protein [Pseudomonadota bacterium]